MKKVLICFALLLVVEASAVFAQKRGTSKGRVCGDPTASCKAKENFEPADLPFDQGKNFVIAESEFFYGIVLKSVKVKDYGDCEKPSFAETERADIQKLFEHNKVFMQNCIESARPYYIGIADHTAIIGIYAGHTLAEANKFLKAVLATGKYPGARVRKMRVALNGT